MTTAFVALGSNLGDRFKNIKRAIALIDQSIDISVVKASPLYETSPVGFSCHVPAFLNGVVQCKTTCTPHLFLHTLLSIEKEMGRVRDAHGEMQSRIIDLDLLLFGDKVIQQDSLYVPHPRMLQRGFVLKPLSDLVPELSIPGTVLTVAQALEQCGWKAGSVSLVAN